jgi:hypothetical protein
VHIPWTASAGGVCVVVAALALWRTVSGRGWHWFAVAGFGLLGAIWSWMGVATLLCEIPATAAARAVSGRTAAQVVCAGPVFGGQLLNPNDDGWVMFSPAGRPDTIAHVTGKQCALLRSWRYLRSSGQVTADQARAINIVVHEAEHLSGIANEAVAECAAIQDIPTAVIAMGGTEAEGRAVAALFYRYWYPMMPDAYRSADCVAGGALDALRPGALPG